MSAWRGLLGAHGVLPPLRPQTLWAARPALARPAAQTDAARLPGGTLAPRAAQVLQMGQQELRYQIEGSRAALAACAMVPETSIVGFRRVAMLLLPARQPLRHAGWLGRAHQGIKGTAGA